MCEKWGLSRGVSDSGVLYISLVETSAMFLLRGDVFRNRNEVHSYHFSTRTEVLLYSALKTALFVLLPLLERFLVGTVC